MEFTVTKEQILEFANWGNPDNKKKLKEWFPKAFELQFEVGKWYKHTCGPLVNYQGLSSSYGFDNYGDWTNNYPANIPIYWREATREEVESALIAEAKKKGYKKGVTIIPVNEYNTKLTIASDIFKITECGGLNVFNNDGSIQFEQNTYACLYASGKWATILPEEKTIITKGKALRIIAKKLKVSPESIEIQ